MWLSIGHGCHTAQHFGVKAKENQDRVPMLYWLPKLHTTHHFSTLYTTVPHNLIKDKRIDLIERICNREGSPYLACNERNAFYIGKT